MISGAYRDGIVIVVADVVAVATPSRISDVVSRASAFSECSSSTTSLTSSVRLRLNVVYPATAWVL